MRSAIGFVTTLATVIHFTFGCCLHAPHVGITGDCCGTQAVGCGADADCDCHDHDPDLTGAASACHGRGPSASHPESCVAAASCPCDGCDCAASLLKIDDDFRGPTVVWWIGRVLDAASAGLGCAGGDRAGGRPPADCVPRSPLFERLLV